MKFENNHHYEKKILVTVKVGIFERGFLIRSLTDGEFVLKDVDRAIEAENRIKHTEEDFKFINCLKKRSVKYNVLALLYNSFLQPF